MTRQSRSTRSGRRAASRAADAALKLPVNSVLPAITGITTLGQTLSCSTGTWSNTPDAFAYQWKRGGLAIDGAVAATKLLVADDVGTTLTCTVVASKVRVQALATSAATAVIAAA